VIHSCYSVCIAVWAIWYIFCVFRKNPNPHEVRQPITKRVFLSAGLFSILSYASGLFWYQSIPLTTIGVNTAVYQASCVFIYIFSIFLLREKITLGKMFSVLLCLGGVVIITVYGTNTDGNTLAGFIWVLASTLAYSLTETLYGKLVHTQGVSLNFSFLFIGLIGSITVLCFWPIIIIVNVTEYEIWQMPTLFDLSYYVLYAFLDTIFNVGFFIGIHLTSPLFMAVGTLLTIPVSVLVDKFWHQIDLPYTAFIGMILVVLGFLGLNLSESFAESIRRNKDIDKSSLSFKFLRIFLSDLRILCNPEEEKLKNHLNNVAINYRGQAV
jgi:drug/metabolite transporter (DMT)-like permease